MPASKQDTTKEKSRAGLEPQVTDRLIKGSCCYCFIKCFLQQIKNVQMMLQRVREMGQEWRGREAKDFLRQEETEQSTHTLVGMDQQRRKVSDKGEKGHLLKQWP